MVLATLAWSTWWMTVWTVKLVPEWAPSFEVTYVVAGIFAAPGLLLALFTVRARLVWVLLAGVPLFANATVFLLPPMLRDAELLHELLDIEEAGAELPAGD